MVKKYLYPNMDGNFRGPHMYMCTRSKQLADLMMMSLKGSLLCSTYKQISEVTSNRIEGGMINLWKFDYNIDV